MSYRVSSQDRPALAEHQKVGEAEFRATVPCRFRYLTPAEVAVLCNGCGSKAGWIKPPQLKFKASCNHHDFNYWIGGTPADRLEADREFYEAMLEDAAQISSAWSRFWHRRAAWLYYRAVRMFGSRAFHHSLPQRGWFALAQAMERAGQDDDNRQ